MRNKTYPTLKLIEDIKKIIEKQVRKLVVLDSQKRKIELSDHVLSIILGYAKTYIEGVKRNLRKKTNFSHYREVFINIKSQTRAFLSQIIGVKDATKKNKKIIEIINKNSKNLNHRNFSIAIDNIKLELGIILKEFYSKANDEAKTQIWDNLQSFFSRTLIDSEDIENIISSMLIYELSDDMFSKFFGGSRKLITNIKARMTNEDHRDYNPDYLFSIEVLVDLINNIKEILGKKEAYGVIKLIGKYWDINRDLKRYIHQQVTIRDYHFFRELLNNEISTLEENIKEIIIKFYWLGFLLGDGSLYKKENTLKIKLKKSDIHVLKQFAKSIGFPINRIQEGVCYREWGGNMHEYEYVQLRFSSKEFAVDLIELGFLEFKLNKIGLPSCVKTQIEKAYGLARESEIEWYQTIHGKYVCAFLLGFIDADGTLEKRTIKNKDYYNVRIANTNLKLLKEIKDYLKINNKIRSYIDPEDGYYINRDISPTRKCFMLYIPPTLFKDGLMTIKELRSISLPRKRIA